MIQLTQGKQTVVDEADYASISAFQWYAHRQRDGRFYAERVVYLPTGRRRQIFLHRFILGLAPGRLPQVDHIDGDGLNNCRSNLRTATSSQNCGNARPTLMRAGRPVGSRFKGVSREGGHWQAHIRGRRLGRFSDEVEAARAYDEAAEREFGEFARTNFGSS